MLETMRKHSRSLFIYLIFGMLIAAFVISFGPQSTAARKSGGGCGSGTPYVAKVNGREISETTWRYAILFATRGRGATGAAAERGHIKEAVLDALVMREILAQTGEALGFRISDEEVRERIYDGDVYVLGQRLPSKQMFWTSGEGDEAPKFRQRSVEAFAQQYGLGTPERFVDELRRDLLAQKVRELQLSAVRVSPEEVQREYEREENKVDLEMVVFEPALLRDGIEVSAAEIDAYLKDHEAELKAQYDKSADRWKGREKEVRIRDMVFKRDDVKKDAPAPKVDARARAEAALAKVKGGADFAATVKAMSEDDRFKKRGGDVGWRPLAGLRSGQPVIDAVGKLEVGQVSDVIEAPDAFHVVKLIDVRHGDLAFDAVKRDLAEDAVRDARAKADAKAQADAAWGKAKAGTPLDKQFPSDADPKAPGPRLQKLNDVERAGDRLTGIGESRELVKALFDETKPGDLLPKVYEVAGDDYVVRLVGRREPDMQKFQTEKGKLTAELSQQRSMEMLIWWQGMRCQEAKGQIQFDPSYVTYEDTDDKGVTKRRMSYTPCMSYAGPSMLLE
jgi:peptidyl-prolyl cis-trans isomerase D